MLAPLVLVLMLVLGLGAADPAAAQYKPNPNWKIAFVRQNDLWAMNADGTGQKQITKFGNVTGKLSWSKDGKRVAFVRQGEIDAKFPDGTGGQHKCYDFYVTHLDSAGKEFWWYMTDNLGSNSPDWSADDQLFVYQYDLAAAKANSILPEYRIYYRNWDGSIEKSLAPANAAPGTYMGLQPSISPDGKLVAFIYVEKKGKRATDMRDVGMVIEPRTGITRSEAELLAEANQFPNAGGPAFSPDGTTIAYIQKKPEDNGIYLVTVATRTKKKIFTPSDGLQLRPSSISWSPDGQWLVFSSYDGNIYVADRNGGNLKQLSFGGNDYFPCFTK